MIVQGGPGLPLLHEVAKFQRLLNLENDFLVGYWEQRGCGNASGNDAQSVSLPQQVDDLRSVLRWLHGETQQRVLMFGISWGATITLQAVEHESDRVTSVVGISPDLQTASSDAAAYAFLQEQARRADRRRMAEGSRNSGGRRTWIWPHSNAAPACWPISAQSSAEKRFSGLLRELLFGLIRTYGVVGGVQGSTQHEYHPAQAPARDSRAGSFARPPRVTVPVHYVFGEQDALTSVSVVTELPAAIAPPNSTVVRVPDAGHMVHFDQPQIVRSILEKA